MENQKSIGSMAGIILLVSIIGGCGDATNGMAVLHGAAGLSAAQGYSFELIAELGQPAPGGETFQNDFEIQAINDRAEVFFGSDLSCGEGMFLARKGMVSAVARCGEPAPGGGTFQFFFQSGMNARGDVAFSFVTDPAIPAPLGIGAGVFRLRANDKAVEAVIVPRVTSAPRGGTFEGVGAFLRTGINESGDMVFDGIVSTANGIRVPGEPDTSLGLGVFLVDHDGTISSIASPGDSAPGGGVFDYASEPVINGRRDVAFDAHLAGEDCAAGDVQANLIFCTLTGVYLRGERAGLALLARPGDAAPGGGTFRNAFSPVLNDKAQVLFAGDRTPAPGLRDDVGLFLSERGSTAPVVRRGDVLPGGGSVLRVTANPLYYDLNSSGDVTFRARLAERGFVVGLYASRGGTLQLIARNGGASGAATVIPGIGTVVTLDNARINDRGQVATIASLADGRTVLLVATPRDD